MPDTEEIAVVIEAEPPVEKKPDQPRGEDGKFVKTGDAAVDDLKSQFTELQARAGADRTAREAAERRANEATQAADRARQEAEAARTEATDSQLDTVTTGLAAAQSEADAAEREYQTAQEAGDFARAAKAQRAMSKAEARYVRLEEAKADIEARKAAPKVEKKVEQTTEATGDPVDRYVQGRTEPTAKWLREHRDWVLDPKKNAKLTAAHWNAVGEGLVPDTDAYFEHVETFVGLRKQAASEGNGADKQPPKRKAGAPPAAPVTASGGGASGGGTEVRLTKAEAEAATDGITHVWNYDDPSPQKKFKKGDPIGIQEFARRKQKLTEQGAYDRSYTES